LCCNAAGGWDEQALAIEASSSKFENKVSGDRRPVFVTAPYSRNLKALALENYCILLLALAHYYSYS
jgi:hypothetical protein